MLLKNTIKKLIILLGIFLSAAGGLINDNTLLIIGIVLSIGGATMLFLLK